MPFISASSTRLITGAFPLSAFTTSVTPSSMRATIDRTSLVDTDYVFIPGLKSHSLSVDTMVDADATVGGYWDTVTGFYAGSSGVPVTVSPAGIAAGSAAWLADALPTTMSITSAVADGVNASLAFQPTGTPALGVNLVAHAAVTSTTTGSSVDGVAASSNGGVAHLHVTAVSGTPTLDVTIEHSTTGAGSWSTLATFSQVTTAVASQRLTVAAGTSVRRYLRAVLTVAGSDPSYTVAVAFARS